MWIYRAEVARYGHAVLSHALGSRPADAVAVTIDSPLTS